MNAVPMISGILAGVLAAAPIARRARRRVFTRHSRDLGSGRGRTSESSPVPGARAVLATQLRRVPGVDVVARVAGGVTRRRRDARDAERLARELPLLADLLGVAVGAGSTPFLAVEAATRWAPAGCAARLRALVRSCRLGVGFDAALEELGAYTPALQPLAGALAVSERTGAPIAPALARLADDARASTRRRVEARARTVPVRLLFPLVFLVLPAFALLTVAPALLSGLART